MTSRDMMRTWQVVCDSPGDRVRRLRVPNGWLYQVERLEHSEPVSSQPGTYTSGWTSPVFVSESGYAAKNPLPDDAP